jgi:DnaJ-class molecular chaperone
VPEELYSLLEVDRKATDEELKKAYRRQARRWHPDYNPGDPTAERRFKEVSYAYQVLSDPVRRLQYDRFGRVFSDGRSAGPFGTQSEVDLGAVFGTVLKDFLGRGRKKEAPAQDLRYTVTVSLLEVATGVEKDIHFVRRTPDGQRLEERLLVRVPPGVDTGQKLKVGGKGGGAPGKAGDLIVVVHVLEHPYFQRRGADLFADLPVTWSQIVLGAEVAVPTLQGTTVIRVPAGCAPFTVLKLGGRGLPGLAGGRRGDLFVKIVLEVPVQLSEAHRARILALDKELEVPATPLRSAWEAAIAVHAPREGGT